LVNPQKFLVMRGWLLRASKVARGVIVIRLWLLHLSSGLSSWDDCSYQLSLQKDDW